MRSRCLEDQLPSHLVLLANPLLKQPLPLLLHLAQRLGAVTEKTISESNEIVACALTAKEHVGPRNDFRYWNSFDSLRRCCVGC